MQSSPKVMIAALALTMVFLPFASNAFVGSKEDVAEATSAWGEPWRGRSRQGVTFLLR